MDKDWYISDETLFVMFNGCIRWYYSEFRVLLSKLLFKLLQVANEISTAMYLEFNTNFMYCWKSIYL